MWWMILLALAMPAAAQRPQCDFGTGVASLREARLRLSAPVTGLVNGREEGLAIAAVLDAARERFTTCGCPRLAEPVNEAARLAEQAGYEASAARIVQTFSQAGFRARLALQALDATGCR
jgi:hypothetical protein